MTKYDLPCINGWHPAYIQALESIYCMCQCSLFSVLRVLQRSAGSGLHQPVRWERWSNFLWMKKPFKSLRVGTRFLFCFERTCFILGVCCHASAECSREMVQLMQDQQMFLLQSVAAQQPVSGSKRRGVKVLEVNTVLRWARHVLWERSDFVSFVAPPTPAVCWSAGSPWLVPWRCYTKPP